MNELNTPYLPALTGIRFIAALMVFFHHIPPFTIEQSPLFFIKSIKEFHVGVTIFFVLSGFIITYKYLLNKDFDYKEYLWNRFTKIYPLYFLLTIFTFVIYVGYYQSFTYNKLLELLMNLTLLKGFFSSFIFTGIPQAWTLSVEECFYLISPILAPALFKNIPTRIITLSISIITLGIIVGYLGQHILASDFIPNLKFLFNFSFFGRVFEFLVGMVLAKFYVQNKKKHIKRCTFLGGFGIIISIYALSIIAKFPDTGDHSWQGIIINNFILPLFGIAPFFWGLLNEKTWIQRFLGSKPIQILGKSSYAFYLIHAGIFQEYLDIHISSVLLLLIMLYFISFLLYYFVETPLKNRLRTLM
ncbi:acyltransferase [Echinicola marina]|uniref:acyltransferase family protein n=1 Tax=Echinicola marina TaxID=2859768 RepID=UPI003743131E|nr:acyltransferase [Echinicola marina]